MSEHTAAALAQLDVLLPMIKARPHAPATLLEEAEALHRAIAAFHMEAIRFRIFNVDRLIKQSGDEPELRTSLEDLRRSLEAAGYHTRSHTAP